MEQGGECIQPVAGANARRDFLKKAGIAGAVAWTAPTLLSTAAHAQGSQQPNIQWVGAGSEASATMGGGLTVRTQSITPGMPAGVLEGDQLLAIITTNGASSITAPASGWAEISVGDVTTGLTTTHVRVWARTAAAAPQPTTVTFTRSVNAFSTGGPFRVFIVAYRNVASLGADNVSNAGGATTSHTFPVVTTTSDDSVVVRLAGSHGGAGLWSTASSPLNPRANSGNQDRGLVVFDSLQATAGNSPATSLGISPALNAVKHSVVLNPL